MQESDDLMRVISKIRSLESPLTELKSTCEIKLETISKNLSDSELRRQSHYWRTRLHYDAVRRLNLFVQQNFHYIEPMGLLTVTRYLFELIVWLNLVSQDAREAQIYYYELIQSQIQYHKAERANLIREIHFLEEYGKLENDLLSLARKSINTDDIDKIRDEVDDEVARKFSIYGEQAKINGYTFQAYLIQNKVLPKIEGRLIELQIELEAFKSESPSDVLELIRKRWNWKEEAQKVNLGSEYEYIYSYTSKLIHATPASLTTEQQNLELPEFYIFLKYIYIRMNDVIQLVTRETKN